MQSVSRDGKFGLLDSTGAELVPCAYDGLVWDGGTAWVKLADGWHEYTIPGVTKPDPLDDLPESIVAPDTRPHTDGYCIFHGGCHSTNRLNCAPDPGLRRHPRKTSSTRACTGIRRPGGTGTVRPTVRATQLWPSQSGAFGVA